MCFKLVVHYTACDFRRKVQLKQDPRLPVDDAPFTDYNIYYPFEAPGRCAHYVPPEDITPELEGFCPQHGTCCESFERYMCDQLVYRGHFNCMGHTLVAHLIRNVEVTADQPTSPSLSISSQFGPSLPVANKSVLFKTLDDYLQVGIEIHHALNNYYENIPGEPQEGETFEAAHPELIARWKSARREWSRGSLNYLSSSKRRSPDSDYPDLAHRAFAPYWIEEFRIPKVRYVPEYLPYDEEYFKDSWEYDSESNNPSQSDSPGNVSNNDGMSDENKNNEDIHNDTNQGNQDHSDGDQNGGNYQDEVQGNGSEDDEDPGWHGGYGNYLSLDDSDENSDDSSSDQSESHDSDDHHSATSNSNSNRPASDTQLLRGPSSNETPNSEIDSSDWASRSDSVESLPSPSLPQPGQPGFNNTPGYVFYGLPDPEFENRDFEPYGNIEDLRIHSGSPEQLGNGEFSSDSDYDNRSRTRRPGLDQVIEPSLESESESKSEKDESTETSLEEYNPEDWGGSEAGQGPTAPHMNFDSATSAADAAVATGHSWPVEALASSAIEYLDLWAQNRANDCRHTGGSEFLQPGPGDVDQPFEPGRQPNEASNEEVSVPQDQDPPDHGASETDPEGNSGAEGGECHGGGEEDENLDFNDAEQSSSSSGADADVDTNDSDDSHYDHEPDTADPDANPGADPGNNVDNQTEAGHDPSGNHTEDTSADNTNNSSSNNGPRQDAETPPVSPSISPVDSQRVSNSGEGFVDGPPPGRPGADRWTISEREAAAAVSEQADGSAEYSSDDPRNPEYGNGASDHTGDTNSFSDHGGPSALGSNHGGWVSNNLFVNGNGVPAPVANSANRQIQARAQGTGSESNIYEHSDKFPPTTDLISPRRGQVDSENDDSVPASPVHRPNHPLQTSPAPPGPEGAQPSVSPFSYLRIGFPRELYTPPPLTRPWSPLILPEPFTGENGQVPQRRRSVHGGFDVPNATHRTHRDGSNSEFGMVDNFTGQVDLRPVNWNSASMGGARNETSLSPFSRSFRDLVGMRWGVQPNSQASVLAESSYPEGLAGRVINGSVPAAQVDGNESEDLPDYESPEEPSRPATNGVPPMPLGDYNDPDNLPDYESSEEHAPVIPYHSGVAEQNGGFESEDLPDYESNEDHRPNAQSWAFRLSEPLSAHASAAERLARDILLGEQASQGGASNGAVPGDPDSSNSSSASDPLPRSSSEDAEDDDDTNDNDSQGPPGPLPPTQGSSESGDGGGCAPSRSPDAPPPSSGGRGGVIPVAADNNHGRAPTWIDAYGEVVPSSDSSDLSEPRGTKRKSSELADEQPSPPGEPLAGKRRRLTDESGSSELIVPCSPSEIPLDPVSRSSREHTPSQASSEDQPADAGGSVVAASSESGGTKRKASNFEDNDQEEEEFSHTDDEEPLSPVPREWTLRRLSTELRGMGSRVVTKRRRFY